MNKWIMIFTFLFSIIAFVSFLLLSRFVDVKLVLALLAAKFIPPPAGDKGFITMLAQAHITVLVREHEGKAHLHHDKQRVEIPYLHACESILSGNPVCIE